ncbi:hypothetical protein T09_12656 [Trichinella sp. T9]|nr:hypothetical protein T09_12656 [Trichinella sp. T9]
MVLLSIKHVQMMKKERKQIISNIKKHLLLAICHTYAKLWKG